MASGSSQRARKEKGSNFRVKEFTSPQIKLPSHLAGWPDLNIPQAPNSAPRPRLPGIRPGSARKTCNPENLNINTTLEPANTRITNTNHREPDARTNSSPLTVEDGSNERKERLKEATASQKQDKITGKKKNREKGGSENVFNARSPIQEKFNLTRDDSVTPTQTQHRAKANPSSGLPGSSAQAVSTLRNEHGNGTPRRSPAKMLVKPTENSSPKAVPVRSTSNLPTRNGQKTSLPEKLHQIHQQPSAAMTEAQLQANLLRRSGHREFSSRAFEVSDDDGPNPEAKGRPNKGTKKSQKKRNIEDAELDPVGAEIAKQRAKYNDYMNERMKENPDRYVQNGDIVIHELTSEEESDFETTHEQRSSTNTDQMRSATKKDKDRLKRKRTPEGEPGEGIDNNKGSRKKLKPASSEQYRDSPSTGSTAKYFEHQKPTSVQQLKNAPRMTVTTDNASVNAEFIVTLKSLGKIIPKAVLHATMNNLNRENRRSLSGKLESCRNGKQDNPHIRVVTRINEDGDEVELLEEYGKISEPDPHTMSSELTLLTAAKDLIILLSGQRILFLGGETKGAGAPHQGQAVQERMPEMSLMEGELARIAKEYQKEIDKLREENQELKAKAKKSKK